MRGFVLLNQACKLAADILISERPYTTLAHETLGPINARHPKAVIKKK